MGESKLEYINNEEAVVLQNQSGENLVGILHRPLQAAAGERRVGVNLLNPGLRNRVAPNRLYVKLARALASEGNAVLRMDPAGIGDSEGSIPEHPVMELWGDIQQGKFINDVLCMNTYMIEQCGIEDLFLAGSCGGAITALLSAEKDSRIKGLILIDVPVTLASVKTAKIDHLSIIATNKEYRDRLAANYLKSMLRPSKWLRFLMLRADFRAIGKMLTLRMKDFAGKTLSLNGNDEPFHLPNMNPQFLVAFARIMKTKKKILFVCAEKDTDTKLFYRGFWSIYVEPSRQFKNLCMLSEIKDANHIYTLSRSQRNLIEKVTEWMMLH